MKYGRIVLDNVQNHGFMSQVYDLLICCTVYLLGVVSPGPSLLIVAEYSLCLGRKQSIFTALGVVLGIAAQVLVVFVFLDKIRMLINSLNTLKYISAIFFFIVAAQRLFSGKCDFKNTKINISPLIDGLLVEILNPFALIFFLSIFAPYVLSHTIYFQIICLLSFVIIGLVVFCSAALLFNSTIIKNYVFKKLHIVRKISAVIFIGFGIKILIGIE